MRQTAHVAAQQAFDAWVAKQSSPSAAAGAAAGGGRPAAARRRRAMPPRGKQVFASNGCAALPHARRRRHDRPVGPDLDKVLKRAGRGLHQAVDRRPERRDRQGLPRRASCPRTSDADPEPARARRARQVPVHRDAQVGSQWSPTLRKPGLRRARSCSSSIGAVVRVRPQLADRGSLYGHDTYAHFIDGDVDPADRAARRPAVLPRRPRRLRLLVLLGVGHADAARGPLGARRARRGRTTSGRTPTTRSSASSTRSTRSSSCSSAA